MSMAALLPGAAARVSGPGRLQLLSALEHNPAVALFVAHARAVQREFSLTTENATVVADIWP